MRDRVRCLLLEDDTELRETLADVLTREGYEVEPAASGSEAVSKAAAQQFDVMVTDVRMDGMDGLDALSRVKQSLPNMGSLVITGYAGEADTIRALRLDAGDYLRKPFKLADFIFSIESIVAKRDKDLARREREEAQREMTRAMLEALAQSRDSHALRAGRIAREVARELGMEIALREDLQIATLLLALRVVAGVAPLLQNASLSPAIRRCLRECEQETAVCAERSVETKIVLIALAVAQDSDWRAHADAQRDSRLQRAVEAILARLDVDEEPDTPPDHDSQLVSLGCALEAVGDREAARRAFDIVARNESCNGRREAVDACLGLARLAAQAGYLEEVAQRLCEVEEMAGLLGPSTLGHALFEAGLLWHRLGRPEAARAPLQQAVHLLEEIQALPGSSLARLALATLDHPSDNAAAVERDDEVAQGLQVLGRPEFIVDLLGAVDWLFPVLARIQASRPHPLAERLLRRMAREVPREVARLFERGTLDAAARRSAVQAMISEGLAPLNVLPTLDSDDDDEVRRLAQAPALNHEPERPPMLRIRSLGTFEVWVGEARIPEKWRSFKHKYLLAFLAANHGAEISEDVILERFWPDDLERGRVSLYQAKSAISRALGPAAWKGEIEYVVRRQKTLRLNVSLPYWHDMQELERLWDDAVRIQNEGSSTEALGNYRQITQLYRGPYLDGCYMDWALEYRARLERVVTSALIHLADNALECRRPQEASEHARRLLDIDPCHQKAHLATMQAYLIQEQPEKAVRQFEICRRRLRSELEMEPSVALLEAYQRAKLALSPGVCT